MQTNNIKYWKWAVILLAALNIATVGSIFYHNYTERFDDEKVVITAGNTPLNGRFFRHEIGFNDEQMEQFRATNHEYNPVAHQLILEIDTLKTTLFEELNKTQPDTLILKKISDEIGVLHANLKKNTNDYYLKIKSIASEQQKEKVKQAFLPLFKDENVNNYRGNGMGHGQGRGFSGNRHGTNE